MARTCILRAFGLQMSWRLSLVLRLFSFAWFRIYAFVEAVALRSVDLRYVGAPIATRVSFFLSFSLLFIWRCRFFRVFFVPYPLSLCIESTSNVLSFRMVFFYLVTTGWIFDIGLCEISIKNQSSLIFKHFPSNSAKCKLCFSTFFGNS